MGLFADLFSSRPREKQAVRKETIVLAGTGGYRVAVRGGERCQAALESICGPRQSRGIQRIETAWLVPDDRHPREKLLVWVVVRGRPVGYLSREEAACYRRELAASGKPDAQAQCQAAIRGGWVSTDGRKGDYEVWLDLPSWSS